jgi:hypothetical protein
LIAGASEEGVDLDLLDGPELAAGEVGPRQSLDLHQGRSVLGSELGLLVLVAPTTISHYLLLI